MAQASAFNRRMTATDNRLPAAAKRRGAYETVLRAALRLFGERGFGATSVRDIAAAANLQPASLYAHFPSKDHVLAELIQIAHEEHFNRLRAALLESQPDPKQQIATLVRAHVGMHIDFPTLAVVANSELHACPQDLLSGALELRRLSEQLFAQVVKRGIELGTFNVPHAWLALATIGGAGLRVSHWYSEDFELSGEQVADVYVQYAWRILDAE